MRHEYILLRLWNRYSALHHSLQKTADFSIKKFYTCWFEENQILLHFMQSLVTPICNWILWVIKRKYCHSIRLLEKSNTINACKFFIVKIKIYCQFYVQKIFALISKFYWNVFKYAYSSRIKTLEKLCVGEKENHVVFLSVEYTV